MNVIDEFDAAMSPIISLAEILSCIQPKDQLVHPAHVGCILEALIDLGQRKFYAAIAGQRQPDLKVCQ